VAPLAQQEQPVPQVIQEVQEIQVRLVQQEALGLLVQLVLLVIQEVQVQQEIPEAQGLRVLQEELVTQV
jgi:hypothetical protein